MVASSRLFVDAGPAPRESRPDPCRRSSASHLPYDVFPIIAERTPACGTLSSPKGASREKGELILRVCTEGISNAVREAFS